MRDTKVCSESVLESPEGHKGVQSQSQCWRVLRDTKVCSVRVSAGESDKHLKLQTLKHIYQKCTKMSPIKLEPTVRKI